MGAVKNYLFDLCEQAEDDFDKQDELFDRVCSGDVSLEQLQQMASLNKAVRQADNEENNGVLSTTPDA